MRSSPRLGLLFLFATLGARSLIAAEAPLVLNVWPATPPGDTVTLPRCI
jgi:hypothetical protein